MAVEITVPSVGESITEVTVSQWLKKDGDFVSKDEAICELETDKVNQELTAPETGILRTTASEGDTVPIGALIGSIEPGEKPAAAQEEKKSEPGKEAAAAKPAEKKEKPAEEDDDSGDGPRASSVAKKMAAEHGVKLEEVKGSGAGGRITKEDISAHVEAAKGKDSQKKAATPAPSAAAPRPAEKAAPAQTGEADRKTSRERMSSLRKRVAQRLVEAQHTAAMLTTFNEVDMSAVMAARTKYKEAFQKKHNVGLGFMSFFLKASVEALREFPRVNAYIDNDDILFHHYNDIGVAVGSDRGLVVPVIRNVEKMSFAQIEQAIRDYAEKAKNGKLTLDDLTGGTFTISNGGVYGSMMSTPILNPPQSGILGMHNIIQRPVAIDGKVEIRPMMYIALSYDHRIVDGKEAVSFLVRIKNCIEAPERMLFEV